MNEISGIHQNLNQIKKTAENLRSLLFSLKKENDAIINYHVTNLRKKIMQSFDVINAMENDLRLLENQKKYVASKIQKRNIK